MALIRLSILAMTLLAAVSGAALAEQVRTETVVLPEGASSLSGEAPEVDPRYAESFKRGDAYARLMRSLMAIRRGEYGTAVEEIHGALALQPQSPDLLIESAELLALMHRDSEAERLARRALTVEPDHQDGMEFLADLEANRAFRARSDEKSRHEAIRLYKRLLEVADEPDAEVLRKLAQLQLLDGDLEGATSTARQLVEARPGDRQAATMLTELLLQAGQRTEALTVLMTFLADHPYDDDLIRWGRELVRRFEGWPVVDEVLTPRAPFRSDATAFNLFYAEALQRRGKPEAAIEVLETVVEARPRDEEARRNLVLAYRRVRRMADASNSIASLIQDYPEEPLYRLWQADTLENQGDRRAALEAYEKALEGYEGAEGHEADRDAFRQRILMLSLELDDTRRASQALDAMEEPEGPLALEGRARLALAQEQWSVARKSAKALKAAGQPGFGAMLEGEVAVREGRWSEASKRFAEAGKHLDRTSRSRMAEIYREGGKPEAGEKLLREWVESSPDSADARYFLGAFLYQLERIAESDQEMREAIRINPRHAPALNFVGYSLAEQNTALDEALTLVERALEIDAHNGAYLDSLGWVYYQMGRYTLARGPLERAAREMPTDPTILDHLGDLYRQLGESDLALTAWERALTSGVDDPEDVRSKIDRERQIVSDKARVDAPDDTQMPVPR